MDTKQYIIDQRKKGVSDVDIFNSLKKMNVPGISASTEQPKRGFVGEILPTATGIAGGIIGGTLGSVGGPAGIFAGAVGGSTLGGALGETAQQSLEQVAGNRSQMKPGQIAAAGLTQGALEAGGGIIGQGLKLGAKVVQPAIEASRRPIVNFISKMSGYAEDLVSRALERTPGVKATLKGGEESLNKIISSAVAKFHEISSATLEAAKAQIKKLDALHSLGGKGQTASRNLLLGEGKNFVRNTTSLLRDTHNIGVKSDGTLLFTRPVDPSRIVSAGEKNAIQEAFNVMRNIEKNTTISNIDSTLERMLVLQRKTPGGTPTGPETKAIIGDMINKVKEFAQKSYPQFADELEKNFQQRILISQGKEILGDSAHLSPEELSALTKKMLQLFNSGNLATRQAVEKIGGQTTQDVVGASAGALMKQGEQFSVRAQNLTRRGIIEKVFEYIPRNVVMNYIKTGKITGNLLENKVIKNLAKTAGLSVDGLLREAIVSSQDNLSQ